MIQPRLLLVLAMVFHGLGHTHASVWVVYVKQNQALVIKPNGKIAARDQGPGDELVYARIELDKDVGTGDILHRRSPEFYRELIEPRK